MNQYMLNHLTKKRVSSLNKAFSYKKVLVDSFNSSGKQTKKIAWEIFFHDTHLTTLDTLKEVEYYISTKTKIS